MKCPICGLDDLKTVIRNLPYTYKGESITISGLSGQHCPSCDETILEGADLQRFSDEAAALNKRVNATVIDPNFVCNIRKKLKLSQKAAGKIFGGDPNAFSRYESGQALPPPSLIQLLRILNNHPALLDEIKTPVPLNSSSLNMMPGVEAQY